MPHELGRVRRRHFHLFHGHGRQHSRRWEGFGLLDEALHGRVARAHVTHHRVHFVLCQPALALHGPRRQLVHRPAPKLRPLTAEYDRHPELPPRCRAVKVVAGRVRLDHGQPRMPRRFHKVGPGVAGLELLCLDPYVVDVGRRLRGGVPQSVAGRLQTSSERAHNVTPWLAFRLIVLGAVGEGRERREHRRGLSKAHHTLHQTLTTTTAIILGAAGFATTGSPSFVGTPARLVGDQSRSQHAHVLHRPARGELAMQYARAGHMLDPRRILGHVRQLASLKAQAGEEVEVLGNEARGDGDEGGEGVRVEDHRGGRRSVDLWIAGPDE
mmetsp:Transcript_35257/g.94403  ORF Transcript_35257/g.94403 Transcript_35257/m.94403 type:complete len:326 (+) Transcript_35257:57-1034(+)